MKYMDLCVCCVHIHHRLQETLQTRIWQIHILTLQAGLHVRSPFPLLVPSSSLSQSWSSQLLLEHALTLISAMLFCWSHADLLQLFIGEEELKIGVKELKKKRGVDFVFFGQNEWHHRVSLVTLISAPKRTNLIRSFRPGWSTVSICQPLFPCSITFNPVLAFDNVHSPHLSLFPSHAAICL